MARVMMVVMRRGGSRRGDDDDDDDHHHHHDHEDDTEADSNHNLPQVLSGDGPMVQWLMRVGSPPRGRVQGGEEEEVGS
jgi:ABC-type Zn2+ transport system substrate-binding protein/surface adhesin